MTIKAITGSFTDPQTLITLPTSYVTVGILRADTTNAHFDVQIFVSEAAAVDTNVSSLLGKSYQLLTSQVNGADSLYQYLLTLPEYAGFTVVNA